jgi:hypothetical protein
MGVRIMGKRKRRDELLGMLIDYLDKIEFYDGCWGRWGKGLLVSDEEEWEEREGVECKEEQCVVCKEYGEGGK